MSPDELRLDRETKPCTFGGVRGGRRSRSGRIRGTALALSAVALALALAPTLATADQYEPNGSAPEAAGPLIAGQGVSGALETSADRDYFYFYATAPGETQVELTVTNLGGGGEATDIDVGILDSLGTQIAGQAFIRTGETRTITASLESQKYFVEVFPGEGFGDSYSLSPSGATGAFGSYAEISGRCERAERAAASRRARLSRTRLRLQRATARQRRSRYASRAARASARRALRRARRQLKRQRRALVRTRQARQPWCSIAP